MSPIQTAKTAMLLAFHQTISTPADTSKETAVLTSATAMGILLALRVSELVDDKELELLTGKALKVIHSEDMNSKLH